MVRFVRKKHLTVLNCLDFFFFFNKILDIFRNSNQQRWQKFLRYDKLYTEVLFGEFTLFFSAKGWKCTSITWTGKEGTQSSVVMT